MTDALRIGTKVLLEGLVLSSMKTTNGNVIDVRIIGSGSVATDSGTESVSVWQDKIHKILEAPLSIGDTAYYQGIKFYPVEILHIDGDDAMVKFSTSKTVVKLKTLFKEAKD